MCSNRTLQPQPVTTTLIVLVQGFYIAANPWKEITLLLQQELGNSYRVLPFKPDPQLQISTNAKLLKEKLMEEAKYQKIFMIGHSTGGYFILKCLQLLIENKPISILSNIEKVILFSLPSWNEQLSKTEHSNFLKKIELFLQAKTYQIPIIRFLKNNQKELSDILSYTKDKIVYGKASEQDNALIPIRAFYSANDILTDVFEMESKFAKSNLMELAGDHLSVLRFHRQNQINKQQIVESITVPIFHKNILRIAQYEVAIKLFTKEERDKLNIEDLQDMKNYQIEVDHVGEVDYTVKISDNNISNKVLEICHSLKENAFIREISGGKYRENNAYGWQNGKFDREKCFYFAPLQRLDFNEFKIYLRIYNGFNEAQKWKSANKKEISDNTNLFYFLFPLGDLGNWYEDLRFSLVLPVTSDMQLKIYKPKLYYSPGFISVNKSTEALFKELEKGDYDQYDPEDTGDGLYKFSIQNLRGGTLLLAWELLGILNIDKSDAAPEKIRRTKSKTEIYKDWSLEEKKRFWDALLSCEHLYNYERRVNHIIPKLNKAIKYNIRHDQVSTQHIDNILDTCSRYVDGIDHFLKCVELFEGNSQAFQRVLNFFPEMNGLTNSNASR